MQTVSFYIAYLLVEQECVIIPGFGALVVSYPENNSDNPFLPPVSFLGFNSEIRHNDGLLANTIVKGEKIRYKEACLQIRQYVDFLNNQLSSSRKTAIPWVGDFNLSSENKILFTPATQLSCNANLFGLQPITIPTLVELEESRTKKYSKSNKDIIYIPIHRHMIRWTASAAAILAILFLTSAPLNESQNNILHKEAAILNPNVWMSPIKETAYEPEPVLMAEENVVVETIVEPEVVPETVENLNLYHYYIVVASVQSEIAAKEEMKLSRYAVFSELNVISKNDRYRIYVQKFTDKLQAESYLSQLRKDYPQHASAWLLAQ